jgi:UPF0176 protein
MKVLLYYQYETITDPEAWVEQHQDFCVHHNILGRILIGKEGINGTCAGSEQAIQKYKTFVHSLPGFENILFKEHEVEKNPFKNLQIKCRKEIVTLGVTADPSKGKYITPKEVNETQEEIIFFDVRNNVEWQVGRFPNALHPHIEFFRELPEKIDSYTHLKDKPIVLYCTGGIRCEKAYDLFKKKGFVNVKQLKGGIYNYCMHYPKGLFQGSCFVFDKRMHIRFTENGVTETIPEENIISSCDFCGTKSNRIVNDEREKHKMVICCEHCDKQLDISRVRYKGEI